MNTEETRQAATVPTEAAEPSHRKRPWVYPVLILENARYATRGKINNNSEFILGTSHEGLMS
jgi:hypothetical protein